MLINHGVWEACLEESRSRESQRETYEQEDDEEGSRSQGSQGWFEYLSAKLRRVKWLVRSADHSLHFYLCHRSSCFTLLLCSIASFFFFASFYFFAGPRPAWQRCNLSGLKVRRPDAAALPGSQRLVCSNDARCGYAERWRLVDSGRWGSWGDSSQTSQSTGWEERDLYAQGGGVVPVPSSWKHRDKAEMELHVVDVTDEDGGKILQSIEKGLQANAHRGCTGTFISAYPKILKLERVENMALWKQYWHRKREMVDIMRAHNIRSSGLSPAPPYLANPRLTNPDQLMAQGLNEVFLYHGTSVEIAAIVSKHGFDERVSNNGLYGKGLYFADESCKAGQYAKSQYSRECGETTKTILISRVTLGDPHYVKPGKQRDHVATRRAPARTDTTTQGLTYLQIIIHYL